ncbi:hypothetical protein LSTR_LSTR010871 [Laodelphax striatellus]|uniref:Uncharacterized protein n=1 Tax=Laodelphax striatellus TaxID=195883 RepID=A0A482XD49_LAOST|nr:hypothetical protein LSTR_LSTR010871 [Laodelphax striatellus]
MAGTGQEKACRPRAVVVATHHRRQLISCSSSSNSSSKDNRRVAFPRSLLLICKSAGHSSSKCAADFSYGPTLPKLFNFYQGWSAHSSDSIAESSVVVPSSACTVSRQFESAITLKPVPTSSWRLIQSPWAELRVHPGRLLETGGRLVSRVRILMSGTPLTMQPSAYAVPPYVGLACFRCSYLNTLLKLGRNGVSCQPAYIYHLHQEPGGLPHPGQNKFCPPAGMYVHMYIIEI